MTSYIVSVSPSLSHLIIRRMRTHNSVFVYHLGSATKSPVNYTGQQKWRLRFGPLAFFLCHQRLQTKQTGIHHRHLINVIRIALLWGEWEEEGLYLWMQSFFTPIPSHERRHFNWCKTTCLRINMPQHKTVRSWYFAGIWNVGYQWKNENFSLVMLLKLLSELLECANMDTDSFLPFPEIYPFPGIFPCIFFYSSE